MAPKDVLPELCLHVPEESTGDVHVDLEEVLSLIEELEEGPDEVLDLLEGRCAPLHLPPEVCLDLRETLLHDGGEESLLVVEEGVESSGCVFRLASDLLHGRLVKTLRGKNRFGGVKYLVAPPLKGADLPRDLLGLVHR